MRNRTDIIILAAGSSSRLGRPKQLLVKDGKTLLEHTLQTAFHSSARNIYVVTGALTEMIPHMELKPVTYVHNSAWEKGMSSSIACGVKAVMAAENPPLAIIILLCDQPYISASLIDSIIDTHRSTGKHIINCDYGKAYGPPVLFHHSLFEELTKAEGQDGAKDIVKKYKDRVGHVFFPEGIIDIDTEEDVVKYL